MTDRPRYETDLTDAEWAEIAPSVLPTAGRPGPKRRYPTREIVNALLYQAKTGCQWRMLPHDFPKWNLVRYYFATWTWDHTIEDLNDVLVRRVRVLEGRSAEPTAGSIDSQSVKTTEAGGDRGFDGGKKGDRSQAAYRGRYRGPSGHSSGSSGPTVGMAAWR